ncbi:MAG: response regulator transcription factor [Candidatus Pelagadaptatus aseana]|uniref:response regulator transcription factor n=1 Tax=Candidatus Pelagadaptatus aseana TaxID=3120508 RepID=UPI0039B22D9A
MKLLLIEDHRDIAGIIFDFFELKGYTLDYTETGQHGLSLVRNNHYDLLILDVMLPDMDGFSLCRQLREEGNGVPVLMLTARDTREDTLDGFANGADDYLIKPFDLDILEARIQALLRRRCGQAVNVLNFDDLSLHLSRHEICRRGNRVTLNPTQLTIMRLLISRAPNIVTREEIIRAVWGDDEPDGDILRSHIYQLRTLVDKPFEHSYIKTIPKVGFQLVAA